MQPKIKDYDYMFKVIMLGQSKVGKSSILLRYTRDQFNQTSQTTIGVEYAHKTIQTQNGKIVKLQIWDTSGQQQYKSIMKSFYKGTSAALLVYDLTDDNSLNELQYWYQQIKQYSKNEIIIMLVGNKSDLDTERQVTKQKGLQYAEDKKIAFYEVSAKTNTNIDLIFEKIALELANIMIQSEIKMKQSLLINQKLNNNNNNNKNNNNNNNKSKTVRLSSKIQNQDEKKNKKCCL